MTDNIADLLHPYYGPCDGFRNGECSVCFDEISQGIAESRQYRERIAALEADNARLLAANARLVEALHPGPKPDDDVYRDFNGRWMTHKYSIGYDSNVHWCRAANKYEFVTGRKVDE